MEFTPDERHALMNLARASIRAALGQQTGSVEGVESPALRQKAGCFISLHEAGTHRLRGCVGRLDSNELIINVVPTTARSVLDDPRFAGQRVSAEELPNLTLEVSILTPLEPLTQLASFDPMQHGVYMQFGDRAGCFLPQVARETGWDREKLLDRLCTEKLGMSPVAWRHHDAKLFIFRTIVIGPEPFVPEASAPQPASAAH